MDLYILQVSVGSFAFVCDDSIVCIETFLFSIGIMKQWYAYSTMPWYRKKKRWSMKILWIILATLIVIPWIVGGLWLYTSVIKTLPDIGSIEDFSFKQATIITDRNWKELYKLFDENREYVSYDDISPLFIDALVAVEDQSFWDNPWFSIKWILRAVVTDLRWWKLQWWSTLTQQLIKNVMLTPEKKFERKAKEIILSVQINKHINSEIKRTHQWLSSEEIDRKTKEKILELYSNLIFLWNNSYWVEVASQTYFAKPAKDLDVLEAAILAWIPQAPSRHDPYSNRQWLLWEISIKTADWTDVEFTWDLRGEVLARITKSLNEVDLSSRNTDAELLRFLKGLLQFSMTVQWERYDVSYNLWRKDSVLARMYDDQKITESEYKSAFIEAFNYEFKRGIVSIDAPHFVFWIISLLEENYDQELLRKEWLVIRTSLDWAAQSMAEDSIKENEDRLDNAEAWNAALVYLDSQNGDVLAYVWSKDYYNEEIDGQVDIIQSSRQPGSTIKPFVYALWFMNLALTIDSPIYDIPMNIWWNTPQNADWTFWWITSLSQALAWSRNIPAIKMLFAAGWETPLKKLLASLGVKTLDMTNDTYGYPLAIGAWEMKMIELAEAYTHFSAQWKPATINPILEIKTAQGALVYEKQVELKEQVIPSGVASLIREMLSNKQNFPAWWVNTFTFPWITTANKSGTTNVVKWNQKFPRDWWLATYTPTKVLISWAWNTDGSALAFDAFGGRINTPIQKSFVKKLQDNWMIQDQTMQQREVKGATISKLSWKLASYETPLAFAKKSIGYIKTLPTEVDTSAESIQIDSLCNKLPSALTPPNDITTAYYIKPQTIMPDGRDQAQIIEWREKYGVTAFEEQVWSPLLLNQVEWNCEERELLQAQWEISMELIQPVNWQQVSREFTLWHQTTSPFVIKSAKLYLGAIELDTIEYNRSWNLIDIVTVKIPETIDPWTYQLRVVIIDEKWYTDTQTVSIDIGVEDTQPPYLLENKVKVTALEEWGSDVVMLFADDAWTIAEGKILQNDEVVHVFEWNLANFVLQNTWVITYTLTDTAWNSSEWSIEL